MLVTMVRKSARRRLPPANFTIALPRFRPRLVSEAAPTTKPTTAVASATPMAPRAPCSRDERSASRAGLLPGLSKATTNAGQEQERAGFGFQAGDEAGGEHSGWHQHVPAAAQRHPAGENPPPLFPRDRKSTRLNSSHS